MNLIIIFCTKFLGETLYMQPALTNGTTLNKSLISNNSQKKCETNFLQFSVFQSIRNSSLWLHFDMLRLYIFVVEIFSYEA